MYKNAKIRIIPKIILGICLLFVMTNGLLAQSGKISGTVTNAETGEPLAGANVIVIERDGESISNRGAAADMEGNYFIVNLPPGNYTVRTSMMGYQAVKKTGINVDVNHTTTINFALEPTTVEGEQVTVTAQTEVISMDQSQSSSNIDASEVGNVPNVTNV